jgi:predicted ATPase
MGHVEWPDGLVEREHELTAIDAALAGVDEGAGALLLFDGEPGIGKSALLHELTERVRARHVRLLWARCDRFVPAHREAQGLDAVQLAPGRGRDRLGGGPG